MGRWIALALIIGAVATCGSALAAASPPISPLPTPVQLPSALPPDLGQQFNVHGWRSDRVRGVVKEQVRFTFCSSLTPGPFRVSVTESKGWDRHSARGSDIPRFVQGGRFVLHLSTRYAVDVPQCREVAYSWHPRRVMLMPGARAVDITIAYPVSLRPGWPIVLTDREVAIR